MCSTSDGDVDAVAPLPVSRLTPVHPAVRWVGVSDAARRARGDGAPAGGAGSDPARGRVPLHLPTSGVQLILTAQRDLVIPEELRPVRADPETGCTERGGRERQD